MLKSSLSYWVRGCLPNYCTFPSPPRQIVIRTEPIMIKKKILKPDRIRRIDGGFSFIPHCFVADGFLATLNQRQLLLYLFLCLVSDRYGLSFYSYDVICSLLELSLDQYIEARDALIKKNLIAFDGTLFQVLALPEKPILNTMSKPDRRCCSKQQPTPIAQVLKHALKQGDPHG